MTGVSSEIFEKHPGSNALFVPLRGTNSRSFIEWLSKVILQLLWFCIATVCDWLKNLAPLSRPIKSKTKTNRDLPARVFPRLAPATCICFDLWLVHWIVYDCCDWSEKLLYPRRYQSTNFGHFKVQSAAPSFLSVLESPPLRRCSLTIQSGSSVQVVGEGKIIHREN